MHDKVGEGRTQIPGVRIGVFIEDKDARAHGQP
jgi:hypothetical protein